MLMARDSVVFIASVCCSEDNSESTSPEGSKSCSSNYEADVRFIRFLS